MVDVGGPRRPAVYVLNEDHVAVLVATTDRDHERSGRFRARRGGGVLVRVRQCARPRAATARAPARPPRHGPRRDGPLRGRVLVRGHRPRVARRRRGPTGRRSSSSATRLDARGRRDQDGASADELPQLRSRHECLGRPIKGPRALTDDWPRFWHLTFNIARNEWKLRFFGSALGYLWQLMRPLLLFGVLYVFFTLISHVGRAKAPRAPLLRRAAARLDRAVHVLQRGDRRARCAAWSTARPSCARSSSRAWSSRCRSCCSRCSTWPEPARRADLRPGSRRAADAELAGAAADRRAAGRVLPPAGDAAVGAVRVLPRHPADLGRVQPDPVLRLAGDHPR